LSPCTTREVCVCVRTRCETIQTLDDKNLRMLSHSVAGGLSLRTSLEILPDSINIALHRCVRVRHNGTASANIGA
jgi:hypothetical protein